jgi:hypothetical protein
MSGAAMPGGRSIGAVVFRRIVSTTTCASLSRRPSSRSAATGRCPVRVLVALVALVDLEAPPPDEG